MDSRVNKPDNPWSKPLDACSSDAVLGMSPECHGEKTSFLLTSFQYFALFNWSKVAKRFRRDYQIWKVADPPVSIGSISYLCKMKRASPITALTPFSFEGNSVARTLDYYTPPAAPNMITATRDPEFS